MLPLRDEWKQLLAGMVLLGSLIFPTQAALAFLAQGGWAVFSGQLLGFPAMGIEPSTGETATRTGALFLLIGLLCGVIAFAGIRYSLREIRKTWPRR